VSNSEQAKTATKSPDQTPDVRVLLYCFKPPSLEPAAAPPARQADSSIT
jgi:hypothetical protein